MPQKLLVNVAGKQDVREKVRMLLVGEKYSRRVFIEDHVDVLWVRFSDSNDDLVEAGCYVKVECSDDLKGIVDALRANPNFTTVAVDTVEQLQRVLLQERLEREGRDYIKGEDYNWMASMMGAIISSLNSLDRHIVLLSGVRHVNPEGDLSYISPNIFGSFAEQIYDYVDYSLYYGFLPTVSEVTEELDVITEQELSLKVLPDQRYPWIFDSTETLDDVDSFKDIIDRRAEFVNSLGDSLVIELTIPEDDDNIELPKGMSKADKIKKLLDKGANTNNKEK